MQQSQDSFNPWVVPDPSTVELLGDAMPLNIAKERYVAIQAASDAPVCDESHLTTSDSLPDWLKSTPSSSDHFLKIFPSDKSILEVMSLGEQPWEDIHHRSSFLPDLTTVEKDIKSIVSTDIVQHPQTPILNGDVLSERNLANIYVTLSIDISVKPGVVENIQLGQ